jgi:hypothetical protein
VTSFGNRPAASADSAGLLCLSGNLLLPLGIKRDDQLSRRSLQSDSNRLLPPSSPPDAPAKGVNDMHILSTMGYMYIGSLSTVNNLKGIDVERDRVVHYLWGCYSIR